MRARFGLVLLILFAPTLTHAEPSVAIVPLGFQVTEMRAPASRLAAVLATSDALRPLRLPPEEPIVAVWGERGGAAFMLAGEELRTLPLGGSAADAAAQEAQRGAIPGSRLQSAGPLTVFLSDPTGEHPHGALGDAIEARNVTVVERLPVSRDGSGVQRVPMRRSEVAAGAGAVFEDLEPRLADLDRDGVPEIVVVKSYRDKGSAVAVIGKRQGAWTMIAETAPAGQPNGWLNPAAIADFDGDGRIDVALVRTPHGAGVLEVWTWDGARLVLAHRQEGYANHARGSTALALAAALDIDGDRLPELAIPTGDRAALALLSLKGGIRELRRIPLPARAVSGIAALGSGKAVRILVGLEDGRLADVRP